VTPEKCISHLQWLASVSGSKYVCTSQVKAILLLCMFVEGAWRSNVWVCQWAAREDEGKKGEGGIACWTSSGILLFHDVAIYFFLSFYSCLFKWIRFRSSIVITYNFQPHYPAKPNGGMAKTIQPFRRHDNLAGKYDVTMNRERGVVGRQKIGKNIVKTSWSCIVCSGATNLFYCRLPKRHPSKGRLPKCHHHLILYPNLTLT
jgi:hypothetical protein